MYQLKAIPEDFIVEELPDREWFSQGPFLVLRVAKMGRNTDQVAQELVRQLRLKRSDIAYAGLKDKNAVTVQYFSIRGARKNVLDWLHVDGVYFAAAGYTNEPLSLGSLRGNRFAITVRNIDSLPQERSLFPNYFDDQRFGKHNDEVGKALVKGDFAKACGLIDDGRVKELLQAQVNNYVGALSLVPKKLLTLYVHAYQSRLFNRVLEKLVAEEGLEALRQESLPIIGFGTEDSSLYDDVLVEEGITPRDFIIRQLPDLSAEGGVRAAVVTVDDLWIGDLQEDELHEGKKKVLLKFSLPKGSYATGVVKGLFQLS